MMLIVLGGCLLYILVECFLLACEECRGFDESCGERERDTGRFFISKSCGKLRGFQPSSFT